MRHEVYVERRTDLGNPYGVWEIARMPRIPDNYLDVAIYLYASESAAKEGFQSGGTGFLVSFPSTRTNCPHIYAVTNRHVITDEREDSSEQPVPHPVIRLNTQDGQSDVIVRKKKDWFYRDEHDLAVCLLDVSPDKFKYCPVPFERFLTPDIVETRDIGIGDDVFLIGRFIAHDGKQKNSPVAQCGTIAAMRIDPVHHKTQKSKTQASVLVEVKTIGGFSGSPVFVYIPPWEKITGDRDFSELEQEEIEKQRGPWLLGVEWGTTTNPFNLSETWLTCIVPAWHLADLLGKEELEMKRQKINAKHTKEIQESGTSLTSAVPPSITEADFVTALKKVSRKRPKPSESGQEKPGT